MTFRRDIGAEAVKSLQRESGSDAILGFLTITSPSLNSPVRFVSDVMDYMKDGKLYDGCPFGFSLLTDGDSQPEANLVVQNVDRRIGQALRRVNERLKLDLEVCSSAEFNLSVEPRTELGTTAVIYKFANFELSDIDCNDAQVTGKVTIMDPSAEPWPATRATQRVAPGLFR